MGTRAMSWSEPKGVARKRPVGGRWDEREREQERDREGLVSWLDRERIYPNRSRVSGCCVRTCAVWEVDKFQQKKNI